VKVGSFYTKRQAQRDEKNVTLPQLLRAKARIERLPSDKSAVSDVSSPLGNCNNTQRWDAGNR
jgi:hypothetical protein